MRSPDVDRYLESLDDERRKLVGALREAILAISPEIVESMKWKAPNYRLADDFATFSLRRPGLVQVILHTGAKPKPQHPQIVVDDPAKLLTLPDRNRAIATVARGQVDDFAAIVRQWAGQLE